MFGIFKKKPIEQKESATTKATFSGPQEAKWSPRKYASFADEGYQKNVIAYQAINKTAKAVAAIPFYICRKRNQEELIEHPLKDLLMRPNPQQSYPSFIEDVVGYYRLSGNTYLERVMVRETPTELYTHRPDRFAIKTNDMGISQYVYRVGQSKPIKWDVNQITGQSDIKHIKTFNPLDDLYGLSPVQAGAYGIDQHNEASAYIQALLQNQASPSGVFSSEAEVGDRTYNRLKADIDQKYSGSRNAGRPMLLDGGIKWQQVGLSPTDMGIIEVKYSSARDVSLAFGVPPLMLNIPGDSTYNNYKEARLAFYEETVIPLAEEIIGELNAWFNRIFPDVEIKLNLDAVPAIQEKRFALWQMIDSSGELSINEKREMKGFEKRTEPAADEIYIDSGKIPLSFDAPQDEEGTGEEADRAGQEAYGNSDRE